MATTVETARARRQLVVDEAGWRTISFVSVLAGTLVALGAVALLAAAAGAGGSALGVDTDGVSTDEWRQAGLVAGAVSAVVLFGSFFFGGYTAGRMGRRAGAAHGLLVFLMTIVMLGGVALLGWAVADDVSADSLRGDLRDEGVPTDENTWGDIGIGVGIAAGVAMLLGSVLGGIKGDRWHGRLAAAVVEHREAMVDEERERTRRQHTEIGDTPVDRVDGTSAIDLRDDEHRTLDGDGDGDADRTISLEEERDPLRDDRVDDTQTQTRSF